MKRSLVTGAVVATVLVAAGALAWRGLSGPDVPQVAELLDAAQTVAFVSAEGLDGLVADADHIAALLPDFVRSAAPDLFDPVARKARLGFDPATAAGWASAGLDARAGGALVFDARMAQAGPAGTSVPIALVRVHDAAALAATATRMGGGKVVVDGAEGSVHPAQVAGLNGWSARISDWLAMAGPETPETATAGMRAGLTAFAAGGGPSLADDAAFRAAVAEAPEAPRVLAYVGVAGLTTWLQPTGGVAPGAMPGASGASQVVAAATGQMGRLVRGLAVYKTPTGSGMRLVTTAEGASALRQCFVPARTPPHLARYVPRTGWAAVRVSVNLVEVLEGLLVLLPPEPFMLRAGVGGARLALALATGIAWDDFGRALSGHGLVAVDQAASEVAVVDAVAAPTWRVILGVADPVAADALLAKVAASLTKRAGVTTTPVTLGDARGWSAAFGPVPAVAVRAGDVIVVAATTEDVQRILALPAGESLAGTQAGDALDGPAVVAVTAFPPAVAASAGTTPAAKPPVSKAEAQVLLRLVVDERGLHGTGPDAAGAALLAAVGRALFLRNVTGWLPTSAAPGPATVAAAP